jgi:RNA polymerase sigma-70 factor, ECF subfamily
VESRGAVAWGVHFTGRPPRGFRGEPTRGARFPARTAARPVRPPKDVTEARRTDGAVNGSRERVNSVPVQPERTVTLAVEQRRTDKDAALVEALREERVDAAEMLVTNYGDRVYRLAIGITGQPADAEEVTQDALWTAARKIHLFKGDSAFGSWLYRITANAAYQKLRARRNRRQEIAWADVVPALDPDGHFEPMEDWSARVDDPSLQKELRDTLARAIDALPPDYRTALVMHDVEGLSGPEIAEALGVSLPAVKSRLHRSRLFVRRQLSDYMGVAQEQAR